MMVYLGREIGKNFKKCTFTIQYGQNRASMGRAQIKLIFSIRNKKMRL